MTPTSLPVIPSKPTAQVYGQSDLGLFKSFSRDGFEQAFGVQPPTFDPSKAPKLWFDTSGGTVYNIIIQGPSGFVYSKLVLTPESAAAVNIPGSRHYDSWKPAASGAMRGGGAVNPLDLATPEQAEALRVEIGGSGVEEDTGGPWYPFSYAASESRRALNVIAANGVKYYAGRLLNDKYSKGVGAPGKWGTSTDGAPVWIADYVPPAPEPTKPYTPFPVRLLDADERIQASPVGSLQVVRGSLPTTSGGGFTDADRALLKSIDARLAKAIPS